MTEPSSVLPFLARLTLGDDGIWGNAMPSESQKDEQALREKVASAEYCDYLLEIPKHHSIEVMDKEVREFIKTIPVNGVICDVGGCWGWALRKLSRHNNPNNARGTLFIYCPDHNHQGAGNQPGNEFLQIRWIPKMITPGSYRANLALSKITKLTAIARHQAK